MAIADRFTGADVVVEFLPTGGTPGVDEVVLSGDFTSFSMDRKVDTVDITAGSEADRSFLPTLRSLDWTLSVFSTTDADRDGVAEGATGLLSVYPKGKTDTFPMRSFNTIIQGVQEEFPFDGAVETEITGMRTGAMITDVGDVYDATP